MEINKDTIEAILIMLFKLGEYEACQVMLEVYKKYCVEYEEGLLH